MEPKEFKKSFNDAKEYGDLTSLIEKLYPSEMHKLADALEIVHNYIGITLKAEAFESHLNYYINNVLKYPESVTTEDGYTFKRQSDGSYTDGDMTFKDYAEFLEITKDF